MAYLFKSYHSGVAFNNQIVFSSKDIEISQKLIKFISNITINFKDHLKINDTGFKRTVVKVDNCDTYFDIQFSGNSPKYLIENIRNLARSINGAGACILFNDTFATGTEIAPKEYLCHWLNAGDFTDNNVLMSTGSMQLYSWGLKP
jgi:hypothetical protein